MGLSLRPSHRNPADLQPEVCDLCGSSVGHLHLLEADVEGLRGFKICDLHKFERRARVTPSLNDLLAMNPRMLSPDVARQEPIGVEPWWYDNLILREDGGVLLREDGSFFFRESA